MEDVMCSGREELQAKKSRLLDVKLAATRRLMRHAADLASRALVAHIDIDVAWARCLVLAHDLNSMKGEIEEAERKEEEWDHFYEAKRNEMEEFQAMAKRFEADDRKEVQRLRDLVSQVFEQRNLSDGNRQQGIFVFIN
ncbi:hypothetical protein ABZP36_034993 [Zizania latifolia]